MLRSMSALRQLTIAFSFAFVCFAGLAHEVAAKPIVPATLPAAVSTFDLQRYQGIWYEIAHFREISRDYTGIRNAFSLYSIDPKDPARLMVSDQFDRLGGLSHGKYWSQLYAPNPARPGELVRKGRSAWGISYESAYHIYKINEDYTTAVVGEPSGKQLYILSRTPYLAPQELASTVQWIEQHAAYADALSRLRCTKQAPQRANKDCNSTLKTLKGTR